MSEEPISIRCSALPRIMRCPASAEPANIESDSPEARLGRIVHECIARKPGYEAVRNAAANAQCDPDEAAMLYHAGLEADEEFVEREGLILVQREKPLEFDGGALKLTGTPDVWGVLPSQQAQVCDYKTGRVDRNHDQQLRGYAFLILAAMPNVDEVVCRAVWLRSKNVDTFVVTRVETGNWWTDLVDRVDSQNYTDDISVCGFCPHKAACWQYSRLLGVAVAPIMSQGQCLPTTAADLAALYPAAQELERHLAAYKHAMRAALAAGPVALPDGRIIGLETRKRATIDASKAMPIIHAHYDGDPLDMMEVRKSALEERIRDGAPRGMKGKAVDDCMFALESAGALTWTETEAIGIRRAENV